MQISKAVLKISALFAMLSISGTGGLAAADRSPADAYRASVSAMTAHDFERAIPDLKYAADHGVFLAQYYLARLLAVDGQRFTDNREAFQRLNALVTTYHNIDPYLDKRRSFVASAERLLALYYRKGLPTDGIPADAALSRAHLEHAALRLIDTEAQYQLALLDLQSPDLAARGLDTLDMLAETKHHAAAAAQIAIVYSQGELHSRAPVEALGYAMFALKLAGSEDRIWISDILQSLYCRGSSAERERAADFAGELVKGAFDVTDGDHQPAEIGSDRVNAGLLDMGDAGTQRFCSTGEAVPELAAWQQPNAGEGNKTLAKGFSSAVGFIGTPLGSGLKDLESPTVGDENGEPVGSNDQSVPR